MRFAVIFIAFGLIIYFFGICKEYRNEKKLHKFVAWIVSEDDKKYRCSLSLLHYVHNIQIKMKIHSDRCITGEKERSYAKIILLGFSSYIVDLFFCDKLECEKFNKLRKYSRIDGYDIEIHFFMFQLYKYLHDHQCDSCFLGNDMHKKTIKYENKGMWGAPLFDATYELSDFGLVFHKMLYIAYKFCSQSSVFSEEVTKFVSEESFINVIDSKLIDICKL